MNKSPSEPPGAGRVLSIAGLDPSGGAGLLADIKTISILGGFATGVATALTVQNTLGITNVEPVAEKLVQAQIKAVLDDIDIGVIKAGMLCNENIVATLCDELNNRSERYVLVVDPVLESSSGVSLLSQKGIMAMCQCLFPLITLLTPNIPEAEILSGISIQTKEHMVDAAEVLMQMGVENVLLTGGHMKGDTVVDALCTPDGVSFFEIEKIDARNSHGTGCALSSAIACNMAQGLDLFTAVEKGIYYVQTAIRTASDIGGGNGPINHLHPARTLRRG